MIADTVMRTRRLRLVLLETEALRALLAGNLAEASRAQGLELPADYPHSSDDFFLQVQLRRSEEHPEGRPWMARAIVRDEDGLVIGHCGFHGPPEVIGRAEIGYTVFAEHRGRGYATEAAAALVEWAHSQGADPVFASVSPDNLASLAVVRKLGFRQTGVQIDEIDGEELVFEHS